jgi:hypothetical protein
MIAYLLLAAALMQTPAVKNPAVVEWVCPDHDADTQHELRILRVEGTNRVIVTTLLLGDPVYADAATKTVRADLNVQPIAFGDYVATMTAVAGTVKSDPSTETNGFQRVPGSPSKVVVK